MPKSVSTRSAYKMLTCIYLCRTLLFFAPYADFFMKKYNIPADHVIRHYDVTGKDCPKYFVENSNAWSDFKTDLLTYIDTYGIEKTQEIN